MDELREVFIMYGRNIESIQDNLDNNKTTEEEYFIDREVVINQAISHINALIKEDKKDMVSRKEVEDAIDNLSYEWLLGNAETLCCDTVLLKSAISKLGGKK